VFAPVSVILFFFWNNEYADITPFQLVNQTDTAIKSESNASRRNRMNLLNQNRLVKLLDFASYAARILYTHVKLRVPFSLSDSFGFFLHFFEEFVS